MNINDKPNNSNFQAPILKNKVQISKKKAWNKEEDIKLKELVEKYGPSRWS